MNALLNPRLVMLAAGGAVLLLLVLNKSGAGIAAAAVGAAGQVATGAVLGVGDVLGIPRTDLSTGQADLARGDWWAASFNLPAGDFLGAAWDNLTGAGQHGASGSW